MDDAYSELEKELLDGLRDILPESLGRRTYFIGVCGGTASGKSSICKLIMKHFTPHASVRCIVADSFYRDLNLEELARAKTGNFDFDHPSAIDFDLMFECLSELQHGRSFGIPDYSYAECRRTGSFHTAEPADVVLVEGIYVFFDPRVRAVFDLRVFVDVDSDERLARRIQRDVASRGRTVDNVLRQYLTYVKPAHERFIEPCKRYADIVVPRGLNNLGAIRLISDRIDHVLSRSSSAVASPRARSREGSSARD
eukprot:gnl/Chilomastix_cuspidata/1381.p1 GENE.gnl/Chilomastix_cuspidata/1381~~gnl/Chilomastix_cuspidata/1381.p1  ORF type:complete len:254 (-),score=129.89 gnl/Chilomastix_cuspidata/1381:130-891(-)